MKRLRVWWHREVRKHPQQPMPFGDKEPGTWCFCRCVMFDDGKVTALAHWLPLP